MKPLVVTLSLLATACQDYSYTELVFTESFQQPEVDRAADMLLVVDDSPSMAEEQELLGANFQAFVDVVESTYADFRAGVITTDVTGEDAGLIRGALLTPETPDLAAAFLEAVDVGSRGSRDEQGLEAARLALEPDRNPSFIRPIATLHVIVFSDEDDHSPGEVSQHVTSYQEAAGNGKALVHAIVGDLPAGCASGVAAADSGPRYLEASELTGGHQDSICADDYSSVLARIGLDISGLNSTFPLSDLPQPDSLEVWVDGVTMHNRDQDGWTWSPAENAVVFHGHAIPRPGMEIVVSYKMLTAPRDTGAP